MKKLVLLCCVLFASTWVLADTVASGSVTIDGTESITSSIRLIRDGNPSVIGTQKLFPGTMSCDGTCYFETITLAPATQHEDLTIWYNWSSSITGIGDLFLTAYLNGFSVADLANNYLGDAGTSVYEGGTAVSFGVSIDPGDSLVLVFNNVILGDPNYGTADYTVTSTTTPEPGSMMLLGAGLVGLLGLMRRK